MRCALCTYKKGISLIEVIIAVAIIGAAVIYVAQSYGRFVTTSNDNIARVQAAFLLDEGVEAVKTLRGEKWTNVASTTNYASYYLAWNSTKWSATTSVQVIDSVFYRTLVFEPVNRDVNFNILAATTSGTLDIGTRKATVSVAWKDRGGATTTRSIVMYVFNIFN